MNLPVAPAVLALLTGAAHVPPAQWGLESSLQWAGVTPELCLRFR